MRSRLATVVIAALMGAPALAAGQVQSGGQTHPEPRVRVQPRVDVREAQRERERLRQARGNHEETERISRTLRLGGDGELLITNLAGDIVITRGSGNDVQIEAVKVARGRDADDAREMLGLVRVEINERGNRAEARAVYPTVSGQRRHISVAVNYTVSAPAGTRVSARTLSGNVKISDIRGEISAQSTSGNVVITNAGRITSAKTSSGNVEVTGSSSEIPFEAQSMSGDVRLRQVKAPRIQAATISGNVFLAELDSPRIDAQSISGNVEFASPFAKGGRYDFNSHAGTVRIVVVGGSGFEIDATSFSGTIQADRSLNLKKEEEDSARRRQRNLRAVHGDGSALVDITTFSGDVVITKK